LLEKQKATKACEDTQSKGWGEVGKLVGALGFQAAIGEE